MLIIWDGMKASARSLSSALSSRLRKHLSWGSSIIVSSELPNVSVLQISSLILPKPRALIKIERLSQCQFEMFDGRNGELWLFFIRISFSNLDAAADGTQKSWPSIPIQNHIIKIRSESTLTQCHSPGNAETKRNWLICTFSLCQLVPIISWVFGTDAITIPIHISHQRQLNSCKYCDWLPDCWPKNQASQKATQEAKSSRMKLV